MGMIVKARGETVWEPASRVALCFSAQVKSLEQLLRIPSGVSPVESDYSYIDAEAFPKFVRQGLEDMEKTNNGGSFALTMGCLQVCLALDFCLTHQWPDVSPKLAATLEGAKMVLDNSTMEPIRE